MTKIAMTVLAIGTLLLGACTTTGNQALKNETQESISSKIVEGKTTKAEVIALLGNPTETTFTDSGLEVIKYEFSRITPKARNFIPYNFFSFGTDEQNKELVILIDEEGLVNKLVMNESEAETRSGIVE